MRYWQECLISNQAACDDFVKWAKDAEAELGKHLHKAITEEKMDEARGIAHEIEVYENMRKRFESEVRERVAQATYQQQIEGRQ